MAMNDACSIKKTAQVEEELQRLAESVERLDCNLGQLGDKMVNILREVETCPTDECRPHEVLVPLADRIRGNRYMVQALNERILSWLNRIEL